MSHTPNNQAFIEHYKTTLLNDYAQQLMTISRGSRTITKLATLNFENVPFMTEADTLGLMDALSVMAAQTAEVAARIEDMSESLYPSNDDAEQAATAGASGVSHE
ncbi:hypothetical protein SAMN02745127_01838 [Oceanospirillum multiglobuliferum]|uniref:Uncharacterized protein n=1 Tax=Oceanospirillum multiglobuliferum TaxID=64969 RepID=A0A1T4QC14_9GAMM|nr:hypothetical protein [Oceanospirillum multiglobuliferum]OPX56524.1 hypothetical protein BTE48_03615 [Oceanospirillum multiglobuliferum]SKA01279.1 hypothetical protein SAMN02745127_01838 [Oceanospirillum multiglobuliferum]